MSIKEKFLHAVEMLQDEPSDQLEIKDGNEFRQYMKLFCKHYLNTQTQPGKSAIAEIIKESKASNRTFTYQFAPYYPCICGSREDNRMMDRLHHILSLDDIILARKVVIEYIHRFGLSKLAKQDFIFDAPDHAITYIIRECEKDQRSVAAKKKERFSETYIQINVRLDAFNMTLFQKEDQLALQLNNVDVEQWVQKTDRAKITVRVDKIDVSHTQSGTVVAAIIKSTANKVLEVGLERVRKAYKILSMDVQNLHIAVSDQSLLFLYDQVQVNTADETLTRNVERIRQNVVVPLMNEKAQRDKYKRVPDPESAEQKVLLDIDGKVSNVEVELLIK